MKACFDGRQVRRSLKQPWQRDEAAGKLQPVFRSRLENDLNEANWLMERGKRRP
jgi:hypothetical protein